jgi:hypothetical protein
VLLLSHWKTAAQEVVSAALVQNQDDGASEMLTWLGGYLTGKRLLKRWYQLIEFALRTTVPVRCTCSLFLLLSQWKSMNRAMVSAALTY